MEKNYKDLFIYVLLFLTSVACGQANNSTSLSETASRSLSETKVDTPQLTEVQYME